MLNASLYTLHTAPTHLSRLPPPTLSAPHRLPSVPQQVVKGCRSQKTNPSIRSQEIKTTGHRLESQCEQVR